LKSFIKSFSIYGLIPIFGKFIGILLMPMYTRLLTPADYGAQDILVQLGVFFTFLINIEMYHGTGRLFFEKQNLSEKQKLVSTGLWLTAFMSVVIMGLGLLFHGFLYQAFFEAGSYQLAFYLMLIWAPISAYFTYLSVVMRYEKKPRLYFIITNIQLTVKILATVLCVAFLKMGVSGVLLGHIIGELCGMLMLCFTLRKYFHFNFSIPDMKLILSFSLPLLPAVLLASFQKPLIRYLVANLLDISEMGYYTVAAQLASILGFIQSGLRLSWYPHLFEMVNKDGYENEVKRIYNLFLWFTFMVSCLIILNGRMLLAILTTKAYAPALPLIGFIVMNGMLDIIRQISGCGPSLVKKTIYDTYIELAASAALLVAFLAMHKIIGIVGLAVAFLSGSLVKLIWGWQLTKKLTSLNLNMKPTAILVSLLFILSVGYSLYIIPIWISLYASVIICLSFAIWQRKQILYLYNTSVTALRR